MEIVFATGNIDKVNQIKLMLDNIVLKTPIDYDITNFEVVEDRETLKDNAYKKAKALYDLVKKPTIADDTGLFVESLNNRPGVRSHRYAGENASYKDNRSKLLSELSNKDNRNAYFQTCICYIDQDKKAHFFTGRLNGEITKKEIGDYDFGYDQIFKPESFQKTLGQMKKEEINQISHRAIAFKKFKSFLSEQ